MLDLIRKLSEAKATDDLDVAKMSEAELKAKFKEYDAAVESGQVDPWLMHQMELINAEFDKRGISV